MSGESILERAAALFADLVRQGGLDRVRVSVTAEPLTAEQAIGRPSRQDFPILERREVVIEAGVLGARGQAFTSAPSSFGGTLGEVLDLDLESDRARAVLLSTMNATLAHLGLVTDTRHCRDGDPERCGPAVAGKLREQWGEVKVGLVGLNPALAEALASAFGARNVRITDLDADKIGKTISGVEVWDARTRTEELVEWAGGVVITGTTLGNGTFDAIFGRVRASGKLYKVYGVTVAAVAHLTGLERVCPYGGSGTHKEEDHGDL